MSTDYANPTINNVTTDTSTDFPNAPTPTGTPPVVPPIGFNKLTAANTSQWNGHIGASEPAVQTPINAAGVPSQGTPLLATQATTGRDELGAAMTWCLCVAGCAAAATGTITAGAFVVGAGASVAKAAIGANGFGWVKN
jgi:hypothetical protein